MNIKQQATNVISDAVSALEQSSITLALLYIESKNKTYLELSECLAKRAEYLKGAM